MLKYSMFRAVFRATNPTQAVPRGFHSKRPKGIAIATDLDNDSKPTYDLPSPSKAGVIEVAKGPDGKPVEDEAVPNENGFVMGDDTTGWAPRFGWPTESTQAGESLLDHATWLEGVLPDKLYGGKLRNQPPPLFPKYQCERALLIPNFVQIGITMLPSSSLPAFRPGWWLSSAAVFHGFSSSWQSARPTTGPLSGECDGTSATMSCVSWQSRR